MDGRVVKLRDMGTFLQRSALRLRRARTIGDIQKPFVPLRDAVIAAERGKELYNREHASH